MGATYTRQESSNITDGSVIEATHFNNEFNQLEAAFAASTGHSHDGTTAEGAYVPLIADSDALNKILVDTSNNRFGVFAEVGGVATEQFRFQDGAIVPVTDNDIDLGTASLEFKDGYFDGVLYTDSLALPTTTITDILDEDNMASDSATALATQQSIKAYVDAQVTAQDLDFQADSGGALNIDLDSETLTFTGGTGIDTSGSGNAVTFAIDSTVATLTGTQTLTNKTLTTPTIASIVNTGTLTLPTSTDTLVGRATTDTLTNKTLTSPVLNTSVSGTAFLDDDTFATASATTLASSESIKAYVDSQVTAQDLDFQGDSGGALSIDLDSETLTVAGGTGIDTSGSANTLTVAIDSTVTTLTGTQTLTNKTLTSPVISSITNTGTLTLPTSTDTLVGRATTDTLTNKSIDLTNNTLTGTTAQFNTALSDGSFATLAGTETLSSKTLTSPVLNTSVSGSAFLDDDTFATASATTLASSESIKAYVDAQVTASDLDFQGDSGGALSIDLDSETLTVAGGTGIDTSGSANTLTVAIDSTVATLTGSQTLTNKTLTSPVLNGTLSGTAFLDEDNMASDSATAVASQQSIKAYVDSQVTAQDLDFQGDSGGALSIDLDSETFTIAGGTGIDTTGSGNTLSVAIDNTVATKGFAIAMAVAL